MIPYKELIVLLLIFIDDNNFSVRFECSVAMIHWKKIMPHRNILNDNFYIFINFVNGTNYALAIVCYFSTSQSLQALSCCAYLSGELKTVV